MQDILPKWSRRNFFRTPLHDGQMGDGRLGFTAEMKSDAVMNK